MKYPRERFFTSPPFATSESSDSRRIIPKAFAALKFIVIGCLVLWLLSLFTYAPGSSMLDDVIVAGRLVTEDGRPLANEQVEVLLPASYGLSAIEARDPASFGSESRFSQVTTDANGEFYVSFGPWVYHIDFYLFPVTLRIPARAPALYFLMRVPGVSSAHYVIHARDGSFKTFSEDGLELPEGAAPAVALSIREELEGEAARGSKPSLNCPLSQRHLALQPT